MNAFAYSFPLFKSGIVLQVEHPFANIPIYFVKLQIEYPQSIRMFMEFYYVMAYLSYCYTENGNRQVVEQRRKKIRILMPSEGESCFGEISITEKNGPGNSHYKPQWYIPGGWQYQCDSRQDAGNPEEFEQ
jgi:hypothetical protein